MSYNFKERYEDEFDREYKGDFLDFIVRIEAILEKAMEYGAAGDPRMLDIVESLQNIDKEVSDQATFANEERPPVYYAVKITGIVSAYFSNVIENEIARIQNGITAEGFNDYWNLEIKNLENKIYFFERNYPDLKVDSFLKTISELGK